MDFGVDETLLEAVLFGTARGLEMTGIAPSPVGASRLAKQGHDVAVLVGLVGRSNGTVVLNLGERAMLYLTGKLLGEEQTHSTDDNLDAVMELGNMVAGSIKDRLKGSRYQVDAISVPSLVLGANYQMHYARGISTASVEFELDVLPVHQYRERIFSTTISLLRPLGR